MKKVTEENAIAFLRQQVVFRLIDIMEQLSCSSATAHRRIKQWSAFSSLNENGRYYILPDIPRFNENHVWKYNNILFSKYRTLNKTLSALIESSSAGLTVFEANKAIGVPVQNILSQQALQNNSYRREKHMGAFVYYSNNHDDYIRQKKEREKLFPVVNKKDFPTNAESVVVLVEYIKKPEAKFHHLAKVVKKNGINVSAKKIQNLLEHHDLVKKTLS